MLHVPWKYYDNWSILCMLGTQYATLFTIASAMVIYVNDLPWARVRFGPVPLASCLLPSSSVFYCSFSSSPSIKLLPIFLHCVSDVNTLWIQDCF